MKFIVTILVSFISLLSIAQKHSLSANIKGLDNDTLLVKRIDLSNPFKSKYMNNLLSKTDTIFVENNKFFYDSKTDNPIIVEITPLKGIKRLNGNYINPRAKVMLVLLLPDNRVKIKGTAYDYYIDYTVKGSEVSSEYNSFLKSEREYFTAMTKAYLKRDTLRFNKASNEKIEAVSQEIDTNYKKTKEIAYKYIENSLDQDFTIYLSFSYGKLNQNIDKFSDKVLNGVFKPFVDHEIKRLDYLKAKEKRNNKGLIANGKIAPDFTLKNIEGSNFNLYSDKHEFIVLDFWGSWCFPCIQGFPQMKKYYKKYKDRIEFVGVACKDNEQRWKESVKEHEVYWTQLINNDKNRQSDVSFLYAVMSYPTKVIIDKNKKIIGVFQGESEHFYKKLEDLMSN